MGTTNYFQNIGLKSKNNNPVDNTKGDWSLYEGEENLYVKNNITGKTYKVNLTEV